MIQPEALRDFIDACTPDRAESIGKVCLALLGKEVELTNDEKTHFIIIRNADLRFEACSKLKKEQARERKRNQRERDRETSRNVTQCHAMSRTVTQSESDSDGVTIHPSIQPTIHPSIQSSDTGSDSGLSNGCQHVDAETIRRYRTMANAFAQTLRENIHQAGAIFMDTTFDTVSIACGITGEFSVPLWKSYVRDCGDAAVREEIYQMWDEIRNGEEPNNRAAALNKRLKAVKELNQQGTTK